MDGRISKILKMLQKNYPRATIALSYNNPINLLVAVILSAQCTDKRVNIVTKELFKKYKTADDYAYADVEELKQLIRSTGFYNNKAKNISEMATIIHEKYDGHVPDTMEELTSLPGVGRKTANIILFNAFHKNIGIAVDTHVKRLSFRLGLTKNNDPDKIEQDLIRIFPNNLWGDLTYLLIEHGRAICDAKKPRCDICLLSKLCPRNGLI